MKRIIAFMVMLLLLISVTGCGEESGRENTDGTTGNSQSASTPTTEAPSDGNQDDSGEINPETWGRGETWMAGRPGENQPFYINFPVYTGYTEGYGMIAEQLDGTVVIVAGEYEKSPVVEELKDFLPAYFGDVEYTVEGMYGLLATNYEFKLEADKAVTIGDYDMHAFEGSFSFDDDGQHREYQYVIYATRLKSNGAYAYWMVYDVSQDQSNGQLIAEHALNMAKTFSE